MPNPYLLYGAGAGLNLVGRVLDIRSERARQARLRRQALAALAPLEAEARLYEMAPTQAEGYAMGEAVNAAHSTLAARGVGDSSLTGPATARALAPFLLQRETNVHNRIRDLAAAKTSIYRDTAAPGYGQAVAGFLGDAGGLLAQIGGQEEGEARLLSMIERLRAAGAPSGAEPMAALPPPGQAFAMQPGLGGGVPAGPGADEDLMGLIMGFREGAARYGALGR